MAKGIRIEHKFINNNEHKFCPKCDEWLLLNQFAKDNTRWDKLRERCKECRKTTRNSEQEEEFRNSPEQKIKKSEYDKNRIRDYELEYKRDQKNPIRMIGMALRNRLNRALESDQKVGSAVDDLGCTIEWFKSYIESKFYINSNGVQMTWDNWGIGHNKWQIDHIIELHKFDLSNRLDFLKACNYTNIQPLWYEDHIKKGTRPKGS